jgi:predicted nucleic acid-binding protein
MVNLTPEIAERAARLRAKYSSLKAIDSVHLATEIYSGASAFLTNDAQLSSISEIKVLVLKNLKTDS